MDLWDLDSWGISSTPLDARRSKTIDAGSLRQYRDTKSLCQTHI